MKHKRLLFPIFLIAALIIGCAARKPQPIDYTRAARQTMDVQLDSDINGHLDENKGGTNSATMEGGLDLVWVSSGLLKRTGALAYGIAVPGTDYVLPTHKLDDFGTPDDNTDLDATTGHHGLLMKLGGGTTNFLRADGSWAEPPGTGGTWGGITGTLSNQTDLQTELDARCLESVFGDAIGTGLTLDGTTLKTHAALQSIATQAEVDVSILECTASNTYNVVTSGGNNYIFGSNSTNTAIEAKAPTGSGAPVLAINPTLVGPTLGDALASSITYSKVSGTAGQMGVYEANSTDTNQWGFIGADDMSDNCWIKPPDALPTDGVLMVINTPDGSDESAMKYVTYTKEAAWTIHDSDDDTAVADGKQAFVVPASMNLMLLTDVTCSIADQNSATGGATTVVLRRVRSGTPQDMTSTGVTISYNEYTASDETVDTSYDDLATGDQIYVDINAVTTGAVHKGLSCTAVFELP